MLFLNSGTLMSDQEQASFELSPRWRLGVIVIVLIGFAILSWIAVRAYDEAPPIPERVVNAAGDTICTGADIRAGQQVFLRYGLMENGTIWGYGAYLGPDFSAAYLHTLVLEAFAHGDCRLIDLSVVAAGAESLPR